MKPSGFDLALPNVLKDLAGRKLRQSGADMKQCVIIVTGPGSEEQMRIAVEKAIYMTDFKEEVWRHLYPSLDLATQNSRLTSTTLEVKVADKVE